jgi:hypothetical protein
VRAGRIDFDRKPIRVLRDDIAEDRFGRRRAANVAEAYE